MVSHKLDFESMQRAASYFLGTHDFSAFRSSGSSAKTSVRTITDVSLEREDKIVKFEIAGDGFLYNMVRIIVGTLMEVGIGKIRADEIPQIIESRKRKRAGRTAPAEGLYLVEVIIEVCAELMLDLIWFMLGLYWIYIALCRVWIEPA